MTRGPEQRALLNALFDELFPIMRSITGPGIEASMAILGRHIPFEFEKVPSGSSVFDWTVPQEWHFKRAQLWDPNGELICDSEDCNLHVLNYSTPVDCELDLEDLQAHLYSLPGHPEAIPYVTSYYQRDWGFCLSERQREGLTQGRYRAVIQSDFVAGGVPFGQSLLRGDSEREILLSSYLCHPSLANNELSGPLVLLGLYQRLSAWDHRHYSYRFLINPETIGALCFLSRYAERLANTMQAGLVLTCLGGSEAAIRLKRSRRGDSLLDQTVDYLAMTEPHNWRTEPFSPLGGSDERQYCSPGLNLPMGQVARTVYGEYAGYHNSLDTKDFMRIDSIMDSINQLETLLLMADRAVFPVNLQPMGEPQLGRRGLYPNTNAREFWTASSDEAFDGRAILNRVLTVLNYADGTHTVQALAHKCHCSVEALQPVLEKLTAEGLLSMSGEVIE